MSIWQTELRQYIDKVSKMGFPEAKIRDVLRSSGWKEEQIDGGFKAVKLMAIINEPVITFDLKQIAKIQRTFHNDLKQVKSQIKKIEIKQEKTVFLPKPPETPPLIEETHEHDYFLPEIHDFYLASVGSAPILLAGADTPAPLMLASPSNLTIWWRKIQFWTEYFFTALEGALVILGKTALLPIVIISFIVTAITISIKSVVAKKPETKQTPATESIAESASAFEQKFAERILIRDVFKLAGRMFRTRRLRTFLTILGISVGIGTILFLVSLGYGMQNVLFEKITTEEALLTLDAMPPSDSDVVAINKQLVDKIKEINGVAEVSAMTTLSGSTLWKDFSAAGLVHVVDPSYLRLAGVKPIAGMMPGLSEKNTIVVSSAIIQLFNLSSPEEALGKELNFIISLENGEDIKSINLDNNFKVVGVVDDPFSVFAYVSREDIPDFDISEYSQLKVKVADSQLLEPVREQLLTYGLLVSALSETVDQARKVFNIVRLVLGLFGIITLVVSAIGMLNTMTIALLERTQEVGIMKAIGASDFDIWKLFLAEAMIMGFFGGVGGIAMGYLSANLFNLGINALAKAFGGQSLNFFQTPSWFVLTIVMFSVTVGMITGLWPARRASRLDPLDALKYK